MEMIYSHPDKSKVQNLYRRLRIIRNKIAELKESDNLNTAQYFTLDNGVQMTLIPILYTKWFKIKNNIISLVVSDKDKNVLYNLVVGKDKNYASIKYSLLHAKEPEMLAIYIEQLETQVNEALDRVNRINTSDYSRKLTESLFE